MATRTPAPKDQPKDTSAQREVVPEFFSTDTGEGVPTIDPSPAFIFAHHRKRWYVLAGRLVPELTKIPLVAGSNRVSLAQDGRVRFADTQAMLQDRHFRVIPYSAAPNGRSYLQQVDTLVGSQIRPAVITVWETAHAGENRTAWDMDAYAKWLESLVSRGMIAPCTPHRIAEMLEAARTALAKAEHRMAAGKSTSSERVEALKAELAVLEKAAQATRGAKVQARDLELDLEGGR